MNQAFITIATRNPEPIQLGAITTVQQALQHFYGGAVPQGLTVWLSGQTLNSQDYASQQLSADDVLVIREGEAVGQQRP